MPDVGAPATPRKSPVTDRVPLWLKGVAPLVLIGFFVAVFLRFGPLGVFQQAFPPVEELTVERITLPQLGLVRVRVVNGGPQPVTVAQVMVDDANWVHVVEGSRTIERLGSRVFTIPYPWVEGEPLTVAVVSSTGLTFTGEVPVAALTPRPDARYLGTFALLGIYAGVIPVFLGLLWLPFLRELPRRWVDFFLALTAGLLIFLAVDALAEALETAGRVPGAFQGLSLVLLGALGAPLLIKVIGAWKSRWRGERPSLYVAGLIALGIGLHNLGEGLAIGTSYATGEIALGTFLVVGFLLHNTTEGLGIVAPLAAEEPSPWTLVLLGAVAGVPTVLGAWVGGFTYSPVWTTLFLAIGAGAIAQVVYELWRLAGRRGATSVLTPLSTAGLFAGLLLMYATGLLLPV